jgi:hypothetical protein
MTSSSRLACLASVAVLLAACGSSKKAAPPPCDVATQAGCSSGLTCEPVTGGATGCFDPVFVSGHVSDIASGNMLADAKVVALDTNGAPATSVATTSGAPNVGVFKLGLAVERAANGTPAATSVTLRADRAGYASFPSGLRVALPVSTASAAHVGAEWIVSSSLTEIGLTALPAPVAAGAILGTVAAPPAGVGVLVVAENRVTHAALTAVPGPDGQFTIFNVPDGGYDVRAYAKGVNYTAVPPTGSPDLAHAVAAAATVDTVTPKPNPSVALVLTTGLVAGSVNGSINKVSTTFWNQTSVLLVVASTYDPTRIRGSAPAGLRVGGVTSTWQISGVPDGQYRVLAGFETDYLVRDPSPIGGTAVLDFYVVDGVARAVNLDGSVGAPLTGGSLGSFKVTGALRLKAPLADTTGACSTLAAFPADPAGLPAGGCTTTADPTIAWETYSSAKLYMLDVLADDGSIAWSVGIDKGATSVVYGATTGTDVNVLATYVAATPLAAGRTYQVRITALDALTAGVPISTTEDLLGVFTKLP